jgi:hypothetical protein
MTLLLRVVQHQMIDVIKLILTVYQFWAIYNKGYRILKTRTVKYSIQISHPKQQWKKIKDGIHDDT